MRHNHQRFADGKWTGVPQCEHSLCCTSEWGSGWVVGFRRPGSHCMCACVYASFHAIYRPVQLLGTRCCVGRRAGNSIRTAQRPHARLESQTATPPSLLPLNPIQHICQASSWGCSAMHRSGAAHGPANSSLSQCGFRWPPCRGMQQNKSRRQHTPPWCVACLLAPMKHRLQSGTCMTSSPTSPCNGFAQSHSAFGGCCSMHTGVGGGTTVG